ncbi:unnamed protein product [Ceutorhynchus assimilis]|uniref:Cytochrome P450 n=1 Tax=Ceutorhynchus assimilis TaxID=467358 RepID=A0A9N9QN22_9CUCU|nr:unnamed protein product [Ceutorhynchus assimilis]
MWLQIITITTIIVIVFIKWRLTYWKRKGVPYLEDTEFFFGNFRKIMQAKTSFSEGYLDFYNQFKRKGVKHGGIYSMLEPMYIPIDLNLIKHIMLKDFQYFFGHGFYYDKSELLSMHLFNLEGDAWKELRSKLTPAFSSGKIKTMQDIFFTKCTILEKVIGKYSDNNKPAPFKDILSRFTIDIIGNVAFGIECNSLEDSDCQFRFYGMKALQVNFFNFFITGIVPWSILRKIEFQQGASDVRDFFCKMVKETVKCREDNNIVRKDFLQIMLDLKKESSNKSLTIEEITAQCFIFFIGGFETSSTAMTCALFELAQNLEIQEKLRQEIDSVLEKYNGEMSFDAIVEMSYLDKIVLETLRKYPPLGSIPRRCTKDYKIPDSNVIIDKGTMVWIPVWGIHKDPDYYPNPEIFDPENFSEERKSKRPEFTYLPFGEGPKMCIGLRLGMLQTKIGLITVIRKYKLTLNEKTELPMKIAKSVLLTLEGDVYLNAVRV